MLRISLIITVICLFAVSVSAQNTTWTEQVRENTSACSGTTSTEMHCYRSFKSLWGDFGMADASPYYSEGNQPRTVYYNPVPANISGPGSTDSNIHLGNMHPLSVRTLLPFQAPDTKIFVHFMPWFERGTNANPDYASPAYDPKLHIYTHTPTGYKSVEPAVVTEQLRDIKARGYDGLIIDWNGGQEWCRRTTDPFNPLASFESNFPVPCTNDLVPTNTATAAVAQRAADGGLEFSLMIDQKSFNKSDSCGAVPLINQPACIQQRLRADLQYANTNYFGNGNYYRSPISQRRIISSFINEPLFFGTCGIGNPCTLTDGSTCTDRPGCWTAIWSSVATLANSLTPGAEFVFRNSGVFHEANDAFPQGALHPQSQGMFAWLQPNGAKGNQINDTTQLDWGEVYLNSWYAESRCIWEQLCSAAPALANKLPVANVYKGFNAYRAFGHPILQQNDSNGFNAKVMSAECGRVWLDSWDKIRVHADSSGGNMPQLVQVSTWNDYDEGTAIEPGIENCVAVNAGIDYDPYGTYMRANWVIGGQENTIDHFEVFASTSDDDEENITLLGDNIPASQRSFDLMPFARAAGNWWVYVKAVGKAGMTNKISSAILWCGASGLPLCRPSRPARGTPSEQFNFMAASPPPDPMPEPEPDLDPPPDPNSCENPDPNLPPMECGPNGH